MTTTTEPRSELVLLEPRNRATLDDERAGLVADVESHLPTEIVSPAEYAAVAELEQRVDRFIARVEPAFDQHVADARRVWQSACDIRSLFLAVPKSLKSTARRLMSDYKTADERRRRDDERRLAMEQQQIEQQRQRAEAALLKKQGQPEVAAALLATPVPAPVVVLPSAVPDVEGLSYREDWYWTPAGGDTPHNRARALAMLVRPEYLQFVKFDDAALTAFAKRTKGTTKVPGIVFASRQVPVRR